MPDEHVGQVKENYQWKVQYTVDRECLSYWGPMGGYSITTIEWAIYSYMYQFIRCCCIEVLVQRQPICPLL